MSPAAFPNGLKGFTNKRDQADIVYGADINAVQDEIMALEAALGTNPAMMVAPNAGGPLNWSSVKDRFDFLHRGRNISSFAASRSTSYSFVKNSTKIPTFSAPTTKQDPHGLWNGSTGFKVRREGWYSLHSVGQYSSSAAAGFRWAYLLVNSQSVTATQFTAADGAPFWSLSWFGLLTPGATVSVGVRHSTVAASQAVLGLGLSGHLVREV